LEPNSGEVSGLREQPRDTA